MSRMVEVNTSELTGTALDWAVGKAQGWVVYPTDSIERGDTWHLDTERAPFGATMRVADWQPSTRWAQCGPLITSRGVAIDYARPVRSDEKLDWFAQCWRPYGCGGGQTPLVAACRAIVAANLGYTVSVPAELLENA